jgi:hypothetical protein
MKNRAIEILNIIIIIIAHKGAAFQLRVFHTCVHEFNLSEFNFYVRVRTYEKRVTGMQP